MGSCACARTSCPDDVRAATPCEQLADMPAREVKSGGIGQAQLIPYRSRRVQDSYAMDRSTLGVGGYGSVRRGRHLVTGAVRAIKTLPKGNMRHITRFQREIAILKMMDHPGIIKLFEIFEDSRNFCLAMELCEGGELLDKVICAGRFAEVEAAHVMQQVFSAIFYMHTNGICHRDLKMNNFLLLTKEPILSNVIKIIDFGLSHEFKPGQTLSTKAGTAMFVAPEVLSGRYTHHCDLWSVGVITYMLLSGIPPFAGVSDHEILSKVRRGQVRFDSKSWNGVSADAKSLILMLMKLNPQERLSAEAALRHSWIAQKAPRAASVALGEDFVERLRLFRAQNRFTKAVLYVIAGQLSSHQIRGLRDTFTSLDTNGDGLLSLVELREGLRQAGLHIDDLELQELVASIDCDGSGVIDYTEFLAATLDRSQYIQEDVCWNAFSVFDLDHDGKISREELMKVLQKESTDMGKLNPSETMESVWREVDSNHDGQIDFDEFLTMMRDAGRNLQATSVP